jgi:hypothetical protein
MNQLFMSQLYDTLKMSAIRFSIDFCTGQPPGCSGVTRDNMDAYWRGYSNGNAVTATRNAKSHGADVVIVVQQPPQNWMYKITDGAQLYGSAECEKAVAFFWGAAVKRFTDLGMQFKYFKLFNEPKCVALLFLVSTQKDLSEERLSWARMLKSCNVIFM